MTDDYGQPGSYLTLAEGTEVFASGGTKVGTVTHVLAAPEEDIFDGLVVKTDHGSRFVDAPLVDEIYERGVVLTIDDASQLPEPSENPGELSVGPGDTTPDDLGDKLRRAWNRISGNY